MKQSTFYTVLCLVTSMALLLAIGCVASYKTSTKQAKETGFLRQRLLDLKASRPKPTLSVDVKLTAMGNSKRFLVFSNSSPTTTYGYLVETSTDLKQWSFFTNGLASPGETTNAIPTTNSQGFFRVAFYY